MAYNDADYTGSIIDKESKIVGGSLVFCWNKKQIVVAKSNVESEYRVMIQRAAKLIWINSMLEGLGIDVNLHIEMWCDNKATHC